MVTFPCAYHGGFNQGFNCAEAVNFAPADWLRFGAASTERYRSFRKPSVVSHEQLLMKVSLHTESSCCRGACLPLLLTEFQQTAAAKASAASAGFITPRSHSSWTPGAGGPDRPQP